MEIININSISTKQAEADLRRRLEQLQTISQVTEAVSRAKALEEIYQIALSGLQEGTKAERASILLLDADGRMRFKAWSGLSEAYRRALEGLSPWLPQSQSFQPIYIDDLEAQAIDQESGALNSPQLSLSLSPELREIIRREGIRALGFIPLVYQEKLMGKFMLYYNNPHQFTEEELQLAQTIASNIAFATERRRAEEALHRREQEFKALVENAPDIITRYDRDLRIVYVSKALERATGILPEQMIGKTVADLYISEGLYLSWQEGLRQVFATAQEQVLEFAHPAPDGSRRYYQARLVPEFSRDGSAEYVLSVARDITERKRAEDSQRFLADASTVLSLSLNYQTILENVAHLAVPQIADWCAIDVVEVDVRGVNWPQLRRVADVARSDREREMLPDSTDYASMTNRVLQTGRSEFYPFYHAMNTEADGTGGEVPIPYAQCPLPQSVMCVPLVVRGRKIGAITFVLNESGRQYTQDDLTLAEELGRRAGLAVDNARLYRESREVSENIRRAILIMGEQQQQLRTLQRLTNLLNQHLANLTDLLQVMVQSVGDAIEAAQFCIIVLHNPQCDRLVLTVTTGIGTEKLQLDDALSLEDGWLNQLICQNESSFVPREEEEENDPPASASIPASACAVAIESPQGERLGVLAIGNWDDTNAFDEEDRHLLVAVGEQAAIAINNARLIKTLEEREERLAAQNEILASQNQELENQRQQIQLQNLQLMEAARLKSQFLATMSHELRTPMNAIIGFSQLLLRQLQRKLEFDPQAVLTAQQLTMLERIFENGKHLLTLINDILDLSKIEAGHMKFKREQVNLSQLVSDMVAEMRPQAEEKHLDLQLSIHLNNPIVINDSVRLRQVLLNLISNAIKFTNVGFVRLELVESEPNRIKIIVKDTGIGMSPENLEQIFESFRQVDQSLKRRYEGTGLGLAITQSLVKMMGGSIAVSSTLGEGSTFLVEIPNQVSKSVTKSETGTTKKILR